MGEVRRVVVSKGPVRALMLYEQSLATVGAVPAGVPTLRGRVVGSMDAIRCTVCGRVKDWIIGEDAIAELLEHRVLAPKPQLLSK
jgi:hypothetical protein